MKMFKNFIYTKGRGLFRLLPAGQGLLLIEERDNASREAFYSCIEMNTGKFIFSDYQTVEKTWSGVEEIYKGIIFFHRYAKPDMPMHTGVSAFDIYKSETLWENNDYIFSFITDDKVYCYQNLFEGRKYFELDYLTGELLRELGDDANLINSLYAAKKDEGMLEGYHFPETYTEGIDNLADVIIKEIKQKNVITGRIDYLKIDDALLISYHTVNDDGSLTNRFNSIDISSKKTILEVILNEKITAFMPDSFFTVNDLLFLLIEKEKLLVYLLN